MFLARKKRTGDVYAIKVLQKAGMQGSQLEHIRAERNILAVTAAQENPFVVCATNKKTLVLEVSHVHSRTSFRMPDSLLLLVYTHASF